MIIVMANGYASRAGYVVPDLTGKPFGSPEFMKVMQERMGAFEDDMTQVLIPFIDKTFRTIPDRDHRAMAGLSMGGMQTFQVTFDHLDLFSYIGGFSGAANVFMMGNNKLDTKTAFHGAMADPTAFASRVHLLWIGVGTNEPERMKTGLENLHASLDEGKIQHVFYESPGTDHEWQTWRRDLKDFAPRLFQAPTSTGHFRAITEDHMSRCMTQMMQRFVLGAGTLFFALAVQTAVAQGAATPGYLDTKLTPEQRAADLVHRMTLAEKATQMQNNSAAVPRLNIPAYQWWSEALHGVINEGVTEYPEPIGLGCHFRCAGNSHHGGPDRH